MGRGGVALTEADVPIGTRFGYAVTTSAPYLVQMSSGNRQSHVDLRCEYQDCEMLYVAQVANLKHGTQISCGECSAKRAGKSRIGRKPHNWQGEDSQASRLAWLKGEKDKPCVDCGNRYHWKIMQFDHVPERGLKSFQVNDRAARSKRTPNELKAERDKCDLLCPNCHAYRTLKRLGALDDDSQEVA